MVSGKPYQPFFEERVGQVSRIELTRRQLIVAGAVTAGVVAFKGVEGLIEIANTEATNEWWPDGVTSLAVVSGESWQPPEGVSAKDEYPWLVVPGLGRQHSEGQAEEMVGILGAREAVGIWHPNQGVQLSESRELFGTFARRRKRVNMHFESSGLLVGMLIVGGMNDEELAEFPQIDAISAVSCPTSLDDVPEQLRAAAEFVASHDLQGDALQKFVYNFARNVLGIETAGLSLNNIMGRISGAISQAGRQTPEGVSPKVFTSVLKILCETSVELLFDRLVEKGIITKNTKVFFGKSNPSSLDPTVLVDRADSSLRAIAEKHKLSYVSYGFKGGHADTTTAVGELRPRYWATRVIKRDSTREPV